MKHTISVITIVFLMFCMAAAGMAFKRQAEMPVTREQKATASDSYEIKMPDLEVKLELVINKFSSGDKGICNSVEGNFTVTNVGDGPVGQSQVATVYKDGSHRDWYGMGRQNVPALGPGESANFKCPGTLRKCPEDNIVVGWKIIADPDNEIKEMSEGNNTAEKVYPSAADAIKRSPRRYKKYN